MSKLSFLELSGGEVFLVNQYCYSDWPGCMDSKVFASNILTLKKNQEQEKKQISQCTLLKLDVNVLSNVFINPFVSIESSIHFTVWCTSE